MIPAKQPILSGGAWKESQATRVFQAVNPKTTLTLEPLYPISTEADLEEILSTAARSFEQMRALPPEKRAAFLEKYAEIIEQHKERLAMQAELETALPRETRLLGVEIPRTVDQLRQAARAARDGSWTMATIDVKANLRSMYTAMGPVFILGPNNFPFAYNSVSGGDFAAAIAAGCPVVAKGHPAHPGTTRSLAELAYQAVQATQMPSGTLQLIYHLEPEDAKRLVCDARIGSIAFTGSRHGGLALKETADSAGKPIYLEMGSLNPVVLLPGALHDRFDEILAQATGSCLLGMGQFCTNPGVLLLLEDKSTQEFLRKMQEHYQKAAVGTFLTQGVRDNLVASIKALVQAGAQVLAGGEAKGGEGFSHQHTLLTCTGAHFLKNAAELQKEAFGNATLAVVAKDLEELIAVLQTFEGQLCGSIYTHRDGSEDQAYNRLAPLLRQRVGRLLDDKMPTGVMVSSAQNHGGPYPATGHPHFTAVGFPASIRRFAMLAAFDNVRPHRLPPELQNKNPNGTMWRLVNLQWTQNDVT